MESARQWAGRRVFLTGVCGTVGRELLERLREFDLAGIVGVDTNETELFFTREAMRSDPRVQLFLCDVRVAEQVSRRMRGIDVVLHAAAYKHVDMCERSPHEAIMTNILGTQNVISAALDNEVERVIFTSSDKAVNPTSVMGTSKLMAERLVSAASTQTHNGKPIFASIRFGNIMGSRGSVIPLFESQIAVGGPVTLTDPRMTRFVMSVKQASALVMEAAFLARGGEVIVTKMDVLRIEDLAHVMIAERAPAFGFEPRMVEIRIIGSKPGEKLYEELTNEEEVRRTFDWDKYLIVKPALQVNGEDRFEDWAREGKPIEKPYNSSTSSAMNCDEIRALLRRNERV